MVLGIVVRVQDPGLPWWAEGILALVGVLLAVAILYGLYELTQLPRKRRLKRRVEAVEAAAGDDPVFAAERIRDAATRLFLGCFEAIDEGDRARLARLTHTWMYDDLVAGIERAEAQGGRYRVEVRKGPRVDYVGLVDKPGEDGDYVVVRVRAKLRRHLERPDGSRVELPEGNLNASGELEEYWTLTRQDGDWIAYSTRGATAGDGAFLTEEIVGPS
jgi:predicted lipid-binding transport protein (Tim44 family)